MTCKIALFASGSGSNAENIARYFEHHKEIEVSLIVSNNPKAYVTVRAQALGIPCLVFPKEEWREGGKAVLKTLKDHKIDFIALAGFLAMVPGNILQAYPNRIVNIHPSLLPKYGGKGMYGDFVHQAVIAAGDTKSGITIHYVNEKYDEGKTVFQAACRIEECTSPAEVSEKVHKLEYEHYPKVIERLISETY